MKIFMHLIVMVFLFGQIGCAQSIELPDPDVEGSVSLERTIHDRKSVRNFANSPLTLEEVSQILWAAGGKTVDGISGPTRSYPSAGGVYPLEIYISVRAVTGLFPGIYRYDWVSHSLEFLKDGDHSGALSRACLGQRMVKEAPATIVVMAKFEEEFRAYGRRGVERYISMDAGHMGQNVHLQAQSMGLGTVMVGAFNDNEVEKIIDTEGESPLYIMPFGRPGR